MMQALREGLSLAFRRSFRGAISYFSGSVTTVVLLAYKQLISLRERQDKVSTWKLVVSINDRKGRQQLGNADEVPYGESLWTRPR
jgi:hypothetical protein